MLTFCIISLNISNSRSIGTKKTSHSTGSPSTLPGGNIWISRRKWESSFFRGHRTSNRTHSFRKITSSRSSRALHLTVRRPTEPPHALQRRTVTRTTADDRRRYRNHRLAHAPTDCYWWSKNNNSSMHPCGSRFRRCRRRAVASSRHRCVHAAGDQGRPRPMGPNSRLEAFRRYRRPPAKVNRV